MVGSKGRVFALDIDPLAIGQLLDQVRKDGMDNLVSEMSAAEDAVHAINAPILSSSGMICIIFRIRQESFRIPGRCLRRTGTVVDLDWKDEPMTMGPPETRTFSPVKARNLLEAAGFTLKSVADAGPFDYITIAGQ